MKRIILDLVILFCFVFLVQSHAQTDKSTTPAPKQPVGIIISAEDSRLLAAYNSNIQMAQVQLQAAQAKFDGFTEHLGRVYGFDPSGVGYQPQQDGTIKVNIPKKE